jgi:hypothetical protein
MFRKVLLSVLIVIGIVAAFFIGRFAENHHFGLASTATTTQTAVATATTTQTQTPTATSMPTATNTSAPTIAPTNKPTSVPEGYGYELYGWANGIYLTVSLYSPDGCIGKQDNCLVMVTNVKTDGPYTKWIDATNFGKRTIYRLIVGKTYFPIDRDFYLDYTFGWIKIPQLIEGFTFIEP